MFRIKILAVMLLAAFVVAVAGSQAASQTSQVKGTLIGTVGPGFTITLKMNGKAVKKLKAGTYKVAVNDKASIHNFHLFGPGVNKKTSVSGTGKVTWTVKFKKGSYTYRCDIHFASGMIGHFKVT